MEKKYGLIITIFFGLLLVSCGSNNKTEQGNVKNEEELDPFTLNIQKADSIINSASNSVVNEKKLVFGINFGMPNNEVRKKLSVLSSQKGHHDTFYVHKIQGVNYFFSVDKKYKNNQLYSFEIGYLTKGKKGEDELTRNDAENIFNYYYSLFGKRGFSQFVYEDIESENTCLFYKGNMVVKMSKNDIGSIYLEFVNEPVEKNKVSVKPTTSQTEFFGIYFCDRTGDRYIFDDDGTGCFQIQGNLGTCSEFRWKKVGNKVTINYIGESAAFGRQVLQYNKASKTLVEKSKIFGNLMFKQTKEY